MKEGLVNDISMCVAEYRTNGGFEELVGNLSDVIAVKYDEMADRGYARRAVTYAVLAGSLLLWRT